MEMIERVVAAIEECRDHEDPLPSREIALAVLRAMRKPTEAMLESVIPEPTHLYGTGARGRAYEYSMKTACIAQRCALATNWQTMIDEALDPKIQS